MNNIPLSNYPRPNLVRESYLCLNGIWKYTISSYFDDCLNINNYLDDITVPYPLESELSGVSRRLKKGEYLGYFRKFNLDDFNVLDKVLLHFDSVDQITYVYLNNQLIGGNEGGYLPFTFDITKYLLPENELIVIVKDDLDMTYPYGKQKVKNGGMWYTPVSGIWKSVWIESVSNSYIKDIRITPSINYITNTGIVNLLIDESIISNHYEVVVSYKGKVVHKEVYDKASIYLSIKDIYMWTPESPHLYDLSINTLSDSVKSYFAFREISIKEHNGYKVFFLNDKPYFMHGLLDQGYFMDGIYTPSDYDVYYNEIKKMKELGFNTLRKHIKVEPLLYYYYCDVLGMIVWQDMVNNSKYSFLLDTALPTIGFKKLKSNRRGKSLNNEIFLDSARSTINLLYNFPCIVLYTIFNEGWGQFKTKEVYHYLKQLDASRIYDSCSGWFKGDNDIESEHVYFKRVKINKKYDKPLVISEFGGYSYKVNHHVYNEKKTFGYKMFASLDALNKGIEELYNKDIIVNISKGVCASIYTQVSDVEEEINGIMTYDRAICKLDKEVALRISSKLKL